MTIRDLCLEDFDAVNDIFMQMQTLHAVHRPDLYRKIEKPTTTKAWDYEASLGNRDMLMLGAETDGKIVGFCVAELRRTAGSAWIPHISVHIRNLAVHEKYRRKGIGTALYHETCLRGKARGADRIDLKVYSFNDPAVGFYRSLGMAVQSYTMEQTI